MGQFIFKIKLVDVEKVEWLNRRSYSAISLFLGREGRVLLRTDAGLEDWFELLEVSTVLRFGGFYVVDVVSLSCVVYRVFLSESMLRWRKPAHISSYTLFLYGVQTLISMHHLTSKQTKKNWNETAFYDIVCALFYYLMNTNSALALSLSLCSRKHAWLIYKRYTQHTWITYNTYIKTIIKKSNLAHWFLFLFSFSLSRFFSHFSFF